MSSGMIAGVLRLDRAAVKANRVTDTYSLHRVVYSLYEDRRTEADKQQGAPSGILWCDQGVDLWGNRTVLMLADRTPASQLPDGLGMVDTRDIPVEFVQQPRYRFQVAVNPVQRDSKTGRQRPVKGREAINSWFCQRAQASWGFRVTPGSLQVGEVEVLQFGDKKQRPVTLARAHIQGQLEVTDSEQFIRSFCQGIGRGKAFGCGLLQIVPVMDNPFE